MKPLFPLLLLVLSGCQLTAKDVEPDLPKSRVYDANTVTYQLDGAPVVAHDYAVLLLGIFPGGRTKPVEGIYNPRDSTVQIFAADKQNLENSKSILHEVSWQLKGFRGKGTYQLDPAKTSFQLGTYDAANGWTSGPRQPLAAPLAARVTVTEWYPAAPRMVGTFTLQFAAAGPSPAVELRQGFFDVTMNR